MYGARGSIGHVCPSIPLDMILNEVNRMLPEDIMMVYSSLHVQELRQEDFDRAISMLDEAVEHQIKARPELTVIEPVIRSPYLTKLKRLLPTYLEDLQDEQVASRMRAALQEEEGANV